MNKKAIQKTIDLMKNPPPDLYFNMHDAYSRGAHGAKACIAGFVNIANGHNYNVEWVGLNHAGEVIGMPYRDGSAYFELRSTELFCPHLPHGIRYDQITIEHGIDVLERLLETGKVDWKPVVEKILAGR